jgi:hypothetical protein
LAEILQTGFDREIARTKGVVDLDEEFVSIGRIWTTGAANEGGGAWMHRDKGDAPMSCVISSGNYFGGALVLWEARIRVQLGNGGGIFYPAHELTHSVEPVQRAKILLGAVLSFFDLLS